jgi:GNAT superfamily N-acetyltransferase
VDLTWLDPDHVDRPDVDGAVAMLAAARAVDRPHQLSLTASSFIAGLRHGWEGHRPATALARDARGRVAGVLQVWLARWDNTHLGFVEVTVDPEARRRGVGRQLVEVAMERLRSEGRTLALAESTDRPAAVEFAKTMGFEPGSEAVQRRQHLVTLNRGRLDREHAAAMTHAGGYGLLRMFGATPDESLDDIARMTEAINDRPTDDLDVHDEVFSPERVRAFEGSLLGRGQRLYRVVAREHETGLFAGHTLAAVEGEQPWQGWQYDTSVLRAHRGHRLGLVLKIEMLRWLVDEEPQLRAIDTRNAASNSYMIQINELLGYQVMDKVIEWQRRL